ncbi:MAG: zf-HC2 domain-containing protein [Candidatus Aminicenantes bacterium]
MKKCKFESLIDDYLLNRITEDKKEQFEEHYFNCSDCFEQMKERNTLISVIKAKGDRIFQDYKEHETGREKFSERIFAFLTPKQWAAAAVSVGVLLVIAIGIIPNLKSPTPQFKIDNQVVRGGSLSLISPVIDIQSVPSEFKWDNLGEGVEYRIYIYNSELLWSQTTKNNSIALPEEVQDRMKAGEHYAWEVKAFSPRGSLIAVSSRVQFKIESHQ